MDTPIGSKIAGAFVKAQKEFGPALKTSTNPHFKTKYANLSACVEAVIDALNNNGIAFIQRCYESSDSIQVETVFLHESGEVLETGILRFPIVKNDPQGAMATLTYARRGSLMAACGIAPEDDDGQSARITTSELADWLASIESCSTNEALLSVFSEAFRATKTDPDAQKRIIKAKDDKKAKLNGTGYE